MDALPVVTLSILAAGLPQHSRSLRKITGQTLSIEQMLLATIADRLGMLVWMQSSDGQHNRNRPKSILSDLMTPHKEDEHRTFDSVEAFEAARAALLKKGGEE